MTQQTELESPRRSTFSIVKEIAEVVRELFITRYRQVESEGGKGFSNWTPGPWWDGGNVRGTNRNNIWEAAAKLILKHRLPLGEFVNYVTGEWRRLKKQPVPRPNHLCSPQAVADFHRLNRGSTADPLQGLQTAIEFQRDALEQAMYGYQAFDGTEYEVTSPEELKRLVLWDEDLSLSALFRYCLAVDEGYDDIAKTFLAGALVQYLSQLRHYDQVWGIWIPQQFRNTADRLLKLVDGGIDG